jgi:WD40 repeat protein
VQVDAGLPGLTHRTLLITGDMSGDTVLTRAVIEDGMVCEPAAGSGVACEAEPLATFSDHTKYVVRARWSPDGQCFATASYDKTVCLYGCVMILLVVDRLCT